MVTYETENLMVSVYVDEETYSLSIVEKTNPAMVYEFNNINLTVNDVVNCDFSALENDVLLEDANLDAILEEKGEKILSEALAELFRLVTQVEESK